MIAKKLSKGKLLLLFGDIIIVFLTINVASYIRLRSPFSFVNIEKTLISLLIIIIYVLSFYIFDFYNIKSKFTTTKFLLQFIGGLAFATLLITIFFLIFPYFLGRGIFLISLILITFLTLLWRIFFSLLFRITASARNVLIIGDDKEAQSLISSIKENPDYKSLGFIDGEPKKSQNKANILGNISSIEQVINDYEINDIVLSIDPTGKKELEKAGLTFMIYPPFMNT